MNQKKTIEQVAGQRIGFTHKDKEWYVVTYSVANRPVGLVYGSAPAQDFET